MFVVKIAGGGFKGHGSTGLMAAFSQTTGQLQGVGTLQRYTPRLCVRRGDAIGWQEWEAKCLLFALLSLYLACSFFDS